MTASGPNLAERFSRPSQLGACGWPFTVSSCGRVLCSVFRAAVSVTDVRDRDRLPRWPWEASGFVIVGLPAALPEARSAGVRSRGNLHGCIALSLSLSLLPGPRCGCSSRRPARRRRTGLMVRKSRTTVPGQTSRRPSRRWIGASSAPSTLKGVGEQADCRFHGGAAITAREGGGLTLCKGDCGDEAGAGTEEARHHDGGAKALLEARGP